MKLFLEFNDNEAAHLAILEENQTFSFEQDRLELWFRNKEGILRGTITGWHGGFNHNIRILFIIPIIDIRANMPIYIEITNDGDMMG